MRMEKALLGVKLMKDALCREHLSGCVSVPKWGTCSGRDPREGGEEQGALTISPAWDALVSTSSSHWNCWLGSAMPAVCSLLV